MANKKPCKGCPEQIPDISLDDYDDLFLFEEAVVRFRHFGRIPYDVINQYLDTRIH